MGVKISTVVAEERFETLTDANGWYEFNGLPEGVQITLVSYFDGYGHNPFAQTCFDPNSELNIQMFPEER